VQFEIGQLVYWVMTCDELHLGIVKRVNVGMADYEVYWFRLKKSLAGYRAIELRPVTPQEAQSEA
jgi:hypothetical protein